MVRLDSCPTEVVERLKYHYGIPIRKVEELLLSKPFTCCHLSPFICILLLTPIPVPFVASADVLLTTEGTDES